MKVRLPISLLAAFGLTMLLLAPSSHAIVLNDDYFEASGGDATNEASVFATVDAGYSAAIAYSFEDQFLAVGGVPNCTGTWIGNDDQPGTANDKSFFLTAAHCVEGASPGGVPNFSLTSSFTDWDGNGTGSLNGTGHLPPERYDSANFGCGGGACSDIAIIELPGLVTILDGGGQPVDKPIIYDGDKEIGFENSFVGYGSWGTAVATGGSNGGLFPSSGPRRAGATNVINGFFESDKGISTDFDAPGTDNARVAESAVASGDSGSAWWQEHLGLWTIIATTNGGSGSSYGAGSTGARVSQYTDWIKSVYPDAQLWSETVVIGDLDLDGDVDANIPGPNNDDLDLFINDWRSVNGPSDGIIADLNEDHVVDMADFGIFRQTIIDAGGPLLDVSALTGVPEPGSLTLVGLGFAMLAGSRRRRTVMK